MNWIMLHGSSLSNDLSLLPCSLSARQKITSVVILYGRVEAESMMPMPLPVAFPFMAWAYKREGFILVAVSVNQAL